ncbi:MAG: hypothetical protein R3Y16_07235 [Rikenellaceae bacterium]
MIVITKIISDYMQSHRKLTVAGLGSFLSKGDGTAPIFTEFVKGDDGELQQLLISCGASELEAATAIEELVFDIQKALSLGDGATYHLPYLGLLKASGGRISFEYNRSFVEPEEVVEEPNEIVQIEIEEPKEVQVEEPTPPAPKSPKERRARIADIMREADELIEPQPSQPKAVEQPQVMEQPKETEPQIEPTPQEAPPKKRVDWVIMISVIAVIGALLLILYTMASSWMIGELTLPEPLESTLERWVFGDPEAADLVIEKVTETISE